MLEPLPTGKLEIACLLIVGLQLTPKGTDGLEVFSVGDLPIQTRVTRFTSVLGPFHRCGMVKSGFMVVYGAIPIWRGWMVIQY